MYALMYDQITFLTERLIAYTTVVWPLPTMCALMYDQMTLHTECLITYTAGIWPLPTVYAVMSDQITLPTECLVTYITRKRTLFTVCLRLFIYSTLINKKYILMTRRMCL